MHGLRWISSLLNRWGSLCLGNETTNNGLGLPTKISIIKRSKIPHRYAHKLTQVLETLLPRLTSQVIADCTKLMINTHVTAAHRLLSGIAKALIECIL